MANSKKTFAQRTAETIIKKIKEGTAPWQKPWKAGELNEYMPRNQSTGNIYRGINLVVLLSQEREDPRWMTYKQAANLGAQVRKGEQATTIQYWKTQETITKRDEKGEVERDSENKPVKITVALERPRMFMANVFNAEQIDGLPPLEIAKPDWNPIERAENILKLSDVKIKHMEADSAFYKLSTDTIHLPRKDQFESQEEYYATAMHELGHSTGHPNRLNRDMGHPYGSVAYAKEELRAEIASMMLGQELNIGHDPSQHVSYVKSWIKVLEDDPNELFRAAADAEKIKGFVLGIEQKQEISQDNTIGQQETSINQSSVKEIKKATPDAATLTKNNFDDFKELAKEYSPHEERVAKFIGDCFKFFRNGSMDQEELDRHMKQSLGFVIPSDWNGEIHTYQKENGDWSLMVNTNTSQGSKNKPLEECLFDTEAMADYFHKRTELIDIWSAPNEELKKNKIDEYKARHTNTLDQRLTQQTITGKGENMQVNSHHHEKEYLAVPFKEKDEAKQAGAKWDPTAKSWYVGQNADINKLQKWAIDSNTIQQEPSQSPQLEFTEALRDIGFIVSSETQVKMDGSRQRMKVEKDKGNEKSGFYIAYSDGRPAGYAINNRTKQEIRWKAKGYTFTANQKSKLYAEAAIKQQERKAKETERHNRVSEAVKDLLKNAPMADKNNQYVLNKNIRADHLLQVPDSGELLKEDSLIKIGADINECKDLRQKFPDHIVIKAGDLLVPAQDTDNKNWTAQIINNSGDKIFLAGGKKESNFAVAGSLNDGIKALANESAIIIAEGYATADTLSKELNMVTIAAFDSGNLANVAKQLHNKYPEKPIVIAGDDDITGKKNIGREKAKEGAESVGGIAIFPTFAPKEQLENGLTDFNDLVNKSVLGKDAIKRQVEPIINMKIKEMVRENMQAKSVKKASHSVSR